jgi:fused signal recognition particle receptor
MTLVWVLVGVRALAALSGSALVLTRRRPAPPSPTGPAPSPAPAPEAPAPEVPTAPGPPPPGPPSAPEPAGAREARAGEPVAEGPPRLGPALGRARGFLAARLSSLVSRSALDEAAWEELEEALISADVGVAQTAGLLERLGNRARQEGIRQPERLVEALRAELAATLSAGDRRLGFQPGAVNVWLVVGVNGVGKTTTIGKLAALQAAAGRSVVLAAADTFRAAAAEQLELWSERLGAELVKGGPGADPGSVVFDAVQAAAARGRDLVLADTAGRLHTKVNLMEELRKVRRVAGRPPGVVSEVLLVIDATTGQNGLAQARQFAEAAGVSGVVLTKLDGTAKGGIVVAIQEELGIPVKLVGVGEGPLDLVELDPEEFVAGLLA